MFFKSKKVKWFEHKLDGVQKMIWDLEFKRKKTLIIKEEVRREYDGDNSVLHITEEKIKSQKKDPLAICEIHNPEEGKEKIHKAKGKCACVFIETGFIGVDELERLYDQLELVTEDRNRHQAQMKNLDIDIHGTAPTNDYPDGHQGINQQLEALQELKGMIKDEIKSI